MNVANIMHQAIFRRTCLKCNPKANINSVSHWPGDDCKGDLKKISVIKKNTRISRRVASRAATASEEQLPTIEGDKSDK